MALLNITIYGDTGEQEGESQTLFIIVDMRSEQRGQP
jgi:hypothetical protein